MINTRRLFVALLSAGACSSEEPPPPQVPTEPLFVDAFDDGAPMPRGWSSTHGDLTVIDARGAPSGPKALRAQSVGRRAEALAHVDLKPSSVAKEISCRFSVNPVKLASTNLLSVARLDVAGGAILFDLTDTEWRIFGRFGTQQITEGNASSSTSGRWHEITIRLTSAGKIVVTFDSDQRVANADIKQNPINIHTASLELGVLSPPNDVDVEAHFDNVECTQL